MIIAAFSGTGKTTLAKQYPNIAVDFVCMPYKYLPDNNDCKSEACKANPNKIMNWHWPLNYVEAIKDNLNNSKILLIPSDYFVLLLLRKEGLQYTLCYPERSAKEIYQKRFLDRGNTKDFIDIFIGSWDIFLDYLEKDEYGKHIVLKPNQFLSNVINITNFKNENSNLTNKDE